MPFPCLSRSLSSVCGQGHLLLCSCDCFCRWGLNCKHDQEVGAALVTSLCQCHFKCSFLTLDQAPHKYHISGQGSFVIVWGCSQHWRKLAHLWGPASLLRSSQEDRRRLLRGTLCASYMWHVCWPHRCSFRKPIRLFPQHPSVYSDTAQICV